MSQWQLDFKDATTVPAEVGGKRQQGVEVLNVIDEGTSVLVDAQVSADFHAETTLEAVADLFVRQGLPQVVRFVSSPGGSDFPSALVRFCECLGVGVLLCDPHQGRSCGNQPPRVAFPTLPELPTVPDLVDPDRWLQVSDGLHLVRLVRRDGSVRVDLKSYYVGRALAGRHVALHVSAAKGALLVVHERRVIKTLPLKGLTGQAMRFEAFVQLMRMPGAL